MEETKQSKQAGSELFYWLQTIAIPLVVVIILTTFVLRITRVDGQSMDPTLADGELLLVWSLGYEPTADDIVIASIPTAEILEGPIVKRVIATEGQTVVVNYNANTITVDGVDVPQDYINEEMRQLPFDANPIVTYEVPENHVFLMGDNRNHSTDSRTPAVGAVPEEFIMGRASIVLFPFDKFGLL